MPEKVRQNLNICLFWGMRTTSKPQPIRDAVFAFYSESDITRFLQRRHIFLNDVVTVLTFPPPNQIFVFIKTVAAVKPITQ